MSAFNIEVESGKIVKLPTKGKYCERDIVVTATGGGGSYDQGYADGQQSEYDRCWDTYQDYGNRTDYSAWQGGFCGFCWTDELFDPKYPIRPTVADYMFRQTGITDLTKADMDFSECTSMNYTFAYNANRVKLPTVIDMSSVTSATSTFIDYTGTDLSLVFSENTKTAANTFLNANKLIDLIISGVIGKSVFFASSPNLSEASHKNIVDRLKDLTGETAQTITWHKDMEAKLTDAQKATITAKNWIAVYQ